MSRKTLPEGPTVTAKRHNPHSPLFQGYAPADDRPRLTTPPHHVKRVREKKEKYKPNPFRQPIADEAETDFRHVNWQKDRDKIRGHLQKAGISRTGLDRWDNCGAECVVEWSDSADRYRLRASYCKNRHCRPCAKARQGLITANVKKKLLDGTDHPKDTFRFFTLTLKHRDCPLDDQITRLRRCFTRLRQTKLWKKSQVGGVAMLECKVGEDGLWHPHLHLIVEGSYVHSPTLRDEWFRITGDSHRIDVKSIDSAKDAVHYISKYVTKGTDDATWNDPQKAVEYIVCMRGQRVAATFGKWRGFKVTLPPAEFQFTDWQPIGLLSRTMQQASAGSTVDQMMLARLMDALQYDPTRKRAKRDSPQTQ